MSLKLMSAAISTTAHQTTTKRDQSNQILNQLLDCVQRCQKRYGGKAELATEFDSCVSGLCANLEAVLLHGLKALPHENQSALKQVVVNIIGNDSYSFWPFVSKHLTRHEQERYGVLKHIWTDTGRGRAWIRSALNERSLERYFHTLLSNPDLLKSHYEEWALFRNQEQSSMLPDMAAGVASILFAISIDKPELNSQVPPKTSNCQVKVEQIIEPPNSDNNNKSSQAAKSDRKKRKIARQLISFDEDNDSMLSTSVPSSVSSSESNSINNERTTTTTLSSIKMNISSAAITGDVQQNVAAINQQSKLMAAKRQLSIETSGSREKFSTEIPESLTLISQTEIGELTPVSCEINANFESPDTSDYILETPTDISAVLTAVETKNNEELLKKQTKIDSLSKENDNLKEQIKKYVGAIQMLRHTNDDNDDDDDNTLSECFDGLQVQLPDYKGEAKLFERKLVQVAEMHAELMDFNVALQQSLCRKDTLLERLKIELEELRGPMPSDDLSDDGRTNCGNVSVWIPSAYLTGSGSASHHVYQIFLRAGNDEWNIYRRYAQFYALHTDLKRLDPAVTTFDFPPKKSIGKKDSGLVEERRKRLQKYLRRVLAHWPELSHCGNRFLLEQHLAFFKDQKEVDSKNKSFLSSSRNQTNNHYTGL